MNGSYKFRRSVAPRQCLADHPVSSLRSSHSGPSSFILHWGPLSFFLVFFCACVHFVSFSTADWRHFREIETGHCQLQSEISRTRRARDAVDNCGGT